MTYSPTLSRSTIGVEGLNFRVRNGNGCDPLTIITRHIMQTQKRDFRAFQGSGNGNRRIIQNASFRPHRAAAETQGRIGSWRL